MIGLLMMAAAMTVHTDMTETEIRQEAVSAQSHLDQAEAIVTRLNKQANVSCYIYDGRDEHYRFGTLEEGLTVVCTKSYRLK